MRVKFKVKCAAAALLAAVMVFLAACSGSQADDEKRSTAAPAATGYVGALERSQEVIALVTQAVNSSIERNNASVEQRAGEKYFLEPDYVIMSFAPFSSEYLSYTLAFTDGADDADVISACSKLAQGVSVLNYEASGSTKVLTVTGESDGYELRCDSPRLDSAVFTRTVFYDSGDKIEEFFEFTYNKDIGYLIQNATSRCVVTLDEGGAIESLYYAELLAGTYSVSIDSIFGDSATQQDAYSWVTQRGKDEYLSVFSLNAGVLKCEGNSGGAWKTVDIK